MERAGDDHRYFEGLAVVHVLGGLDESDGRVFRSHLLECADCRARVGELRAIASELADVERDERRQRAAKAIETKRREHDDDVPDDAEGAPPPRAPRLLVFVGLALVILLAAWNFTLRSSNVSLQQELERRADAAEALEFGTAWDVQPVGSAADEAAAKEHGGQLVLLVDGLEDAETYSLYLRNDAGVVTNRQLYVRPLDGRVFALLRLPEATADVVLTNPDGQPAPEPDGEVVFQARRPTTEI